MELNRYADLSHDAELRLRAHGLSSTEICATLGAAFLSAVLKLPGDLRAMVLTMHIQGIAHQFPDNLKTVPMSNGETPDDDSQPKAPFVV